MRSSNLSGVSRMRARAVALLTALMLVAGSFAWQAAPVLAAAPAAPVLQVTPALSYDGLFTLSWAPVSGASYYRVYRQSGTSITPAVNETTYMGRTAGAETAMANQVFTEGTFRYAVVAVNSSGEASASSAWVTVNVDLAANGVGTIVPDTAAPDIPSSLSANVTYSNDDTLILTWNASVASDTWRYLLYRAHQADGAEFVDYVPWGTNLFVETIAQDGIYTYHLIAQDRTGNLSGPSNSTSALVDRVDPKVAITNPVAGQAYLATSFPAVTFAVDEVGSGYDSAGVRYYLNDSEIANAVISDYLLLPGVNRVKVTVTDRAGNTGTAEVMFDIIRQISNDAPLNLSTPALSKSRTLTLSWQAPVNGAQSYKIYRVNTAGTHHLAGTSTLTQFADTVPSDGYFAYYVEAVNPGALNHTFSNSAFVTVDTAAPVVTITAPKASPAYAKTGSLTPAFTVTDTGTGVEPTEVRQYLDGSLHTGDINLATLSVGNHTFKVEATDRAGNKGSATVTFKVGTSAGEPNPDPGPDPNPKPKLQNSELISLLQSLRSEIQVGHYVALMAKLRIGKVDLFIDHILRHTPRFISPEAAELLLEGAGYTGTSAQQKPGQGKGR